MTRVRSIVAAAMAVACVSGSEEYGALFAEFMRTHGRSYKGAEKHERYMNFVANMDRAAALSRSNPLARFGMNEYSDWSEEELRRLRGTRVAREPGDGDGGPADGAGVAAAPEAADWRKRGAVTGVKQQGQCGSCWAFSTTGNIEGQWALAGNRLTSLSEQMLVSCDHLDHGCQGGLQPVGMVWLMTRTNGAIFTEASLPYVSGHGNVPACPTTGETVGARIRGSRIIDKSELRMVEFVGASGPLSIAVDAESWSPYRGGVMTNCPGNAIDHGVLIVGYDTTAEPPYWIVKNSWGTGWGENGYIRLAMWRDACGLTWLPSTSVVDHRA